MSEITNADRADLAGDAIRDFAARSCGGRYSDGDAELSADPDTVLADLLCDLMHWADVYGVNFDAELDRGRGHYEVEVEETDDHDEDMRQIIGAVR